MGNVRIVAGQAVLALVLSGCVSPPQARTDIPLVPVPPPPLGNPTKDIVPVPVAIRPTSATEDAGASRPTEEPRPRGTPTVPQVLQAAKARLPDLDSYIVRLTKREMVNGKPVPEELILFKFRARPWSVYFKWLGKEGRGREVLYVKGQHGDKIHSLLAAGDIPFMPAGKRMALSPDNILVKNSCRHPITEAGLVSCLERLGKLQADIEAGDKKVGTLAVLPASSRPEFAKPVVALEHTIPPGADPTLPRGGKRTYWFGPDTHLPMLCIAVDELGREAEYYHHDRLLTRVKLDDADFDPEKLWAKPQARASR